MKKLIILAVIIPSIIFGQRPLMGPDKLWEKEIIEYRREQGQPLVRDAELDSVAKERFIMISSKYASSYLGYAQFVSEFGEGKHGIPKIGLIPFSHYIANKMKHRGRSLSFQEICVFEPNGEKEVLKKGSFINYYRESKPHWEIARGAIGVNEIIDKYDGRLHKNTRIERRDIVNNSKFGSYTGVFTVFDTFMGRNIEMVINVSVFE